MQKVMLCTRVYKFAKPVVCLARFANLGKTSAMKKQKTQKVASGTHHDLLGRTGTLDTAPKLLTQITNSRLG